MGFASWLLKNGPGSPGSTAKAFVKLYEQTEVQNYDKEWKDSFKMIFLTRYQTYNKIGFGGGCLLNQIDPDDIIQNTEGDFPTFIFSMMYLETSQFRNNIGQNFGMVTKVIYDSVSERKPLICKFSFDKFQRYSNTLMYLIK